MGYNYGGKKMSKQAKEKITELRFEGVQICMKCNARNPKNANKCRKCGYKRLRRKAGKPEFIQRDHESRSGGY